MQIYSPIAQDSLVVSGSAFVSGSVTAQNFIGNFTGTASYATSALTSSYALTASVALNVPATASYAMMALTASYANFAANTTSASFAVSAAFASQASIASSASFATNAGTAGSASFATNASTAASASYAVSASYATASAFANNATSASYALSASYATASAIAISSSFATIAANASSASYALNSSNAVSASYGVSASYAMSASYATASSFATTASYALFAATATTASFATNASTAASASFATNAGTAGSASYAVSASYATASSFASSASYALNTSNAVTASHALNSVSASYALFAANSTSASYALSASYAFNSSVAVSASFATNAGFAGSASFATQAANASTAVTASYAQQANTASSADNFNVRGTLTATNIVVQTVTSSQSTITGSTKFGSIITNTHQFTGSVLVTGSITVIDGVTNNLTASWANRAISSSFAANASTAASSSFATNASTAASASFATNASTAASASFATSAASATSASIAALAVTASHAVVAVTSSHAINAVTASFALNSQNAFVQGGNSFGAQALLGTNDAQNLAFETNGTVRMTITGSDGNVGIGTTTPASRLDITFDSGHELLRLNSSNSTGIRLSFISASVLNGAIGLGSNLISGLSTSDLALWTRGSMAFETGGTGEKMRIASGGNVGIGTTTVQSKLHVNAGAVSTPRGSGFTKFFFTDNNAITTYFEIQTPSSSAGDILFSDGSGGDYGIIGYDHTTDSMRIYTKSAINMFISGSGNVGIGNTTPTQKLDVTGYIRATSGFVGSSGLRLWGDNTSTSAGLLVATNGNVGIGTTNPTSRVSIYVPESDSNVNAFGVIGDTSLKAVYIGATGSFAWIQSHGSVPLYINSLGNSVIFNRDGGSVSIGTTNTGYKLRVEGTGYYGDTLTFGSGGNISWTTGYSDGTTQTMTGNSLAFITPVAGSPRLFISSSGNVGIGTTLPQNLLQVGSLTNPTNVGGTTWNQVARFGSSNRLTSIVIQAAGTGAVSASQGLPAIEFEPYNVDASSKIKTAIVAVDNYYAFRKTDLAFILDSADDLNPWTLSDAKLYIKNDGNVGIGSSSPARKLDVNGTSVFRDFTSVFAYNGNVVSNTTWLSTDSGIMNIYTGGNTTVQLNSNGISYFNGGSVGIGTTAPIKQLQVFTGNGNGIATGKNSAAVDESANFFLFPSTTLTNKRNWVISAYYSTQYNLDFVRSTSTSNDPYWTGSVVMTLEGINNRVGIGTTTPSYRFQIDAPSGDWGAYIKGSSTANNSYGLFIDAGTSTSDSPFMIRSADATTTFIRVRGNGDIGIGTSNPDNSKLRIRADHQSGYSILSIQPISNNVATIGLYDNSGTRQSLFYRDTGVTYINTTSDALQLAPGDSTKVTILAGGNVGIGTTTPLYKLHVSGAAALFKIDSTGATFSSPSINLLQGAIDTVLTATNNGLELGTYSAHPVIFRVSNTTEAMRILSDGNVGIGTTSPSYTLQVGRQAAGNNTDYSIAVSRHGTGASPGTWTSNPAITIQDQTDGGPASVDINGLFNISLGRFDYTDTNAANATLLSFTYDGTLGPMRVDGRGNTWIGYNRGSAPTNSGAFGLLVYGGMSVGSSYQSTTPPSNGAIIQGNVGIGTTNATNLLTVRGASAQVDIQSTADSQVPGVFMRYLATNNGAKIYYSTGDAVTYYDNLYPYSVGTVYGSHHFRASGSDGTMQTRLYIQGHNGCIGIGTATPGDKLDVNGGIVIRGANYLWGGVTTTVGSWTTRQYSNGATYTFNVNGFEINNVGYGSSTWFVINSSGNVGINTTAPGGKLHVNGEIHIGSNNDKFMISDEGTYRRIQSFNSQPISINPLGNNVGIATTVAQATLQVAGTIRWSSGVNAYYTYSDMDGSGLYIETVDNNTNRAKMRFQTRVNNSGNYIQYQLDANNSRFYWEGGGSAKATLGSSTGTFTVSGDVVAYGSPSDITLKTNIKPLENSLDKIMKLQGVSFTWKDDLEISQMTGIKDDLGFIAQEVQEVLPELVRKNDNGLLSLRDKGIIPILVEAIKELKAEIDELKNNKQ